MSGYLSNIIQRNAMPGAGQAGVTTVAPPADYTGLFGPGSISPAEAPQPVTEEPFYPVSSPASDTPFSGKKESGAPLPDRIEHRPHTEYIERHLIRTKYDTPKEVMPTRYPTTVEKTKASEIQPLATAEPVEKKQSTEIQPQAILGPVEKTKTSEIQPPATPEPAVKKKTTEIQPQIEKGKSVVETLKPAKENRRAIPTARKEAPPVQLLQPAIDTREITILKPTTPTETMTRTEKKPEAPKLVIGRLTVEVIYPAPKVQTTQPPANRQPAAPEPAPFRPYNKLTFGLGQL